MNDVMIDLETTGADPNINGIIQIAAVRFDYQTMQIGPAFCASMVLPYGRFWDEGTREWWMHPDRIGIYQDIMSTARDPLTVMREFSGWCMQVDNGQPQRMWAKPITFEFPFVSSYGRQFDVHLPFHYRHAVDLHSFTRGQRQDPGAEPFDKQVQFEGDAHNAIDDVFHQIKIALTAKVQFGCTCSQQSSAS